MKNNDGDLIFETGSEKGTEKAGQKFAETVKDGDVILFYGSVGSGKTVFARGLCRGLGFEGYVNSPSYIIMNMYSADELTIYHYDLYRIGSVSELMEIGFYEFAAQDRSITLVEWAEMLECEVPEKRIEVKIDVVDEEKRKITIKRVG